ncbi:MAG: hypothetical protein ACREAK_05310 [Nitrosarchaeum sp.]
MNEKKTNESLAEKTKKAREAVEGQEEPYKTEAFKIILTHLLNSSSAAESITQGSTSQKFERPTLLDQKSNLKKGKSELALLCGLSANELDDVFIIEEDKVEMHAPVSGTEAEKQIMASQCLLVAYEVLLGQEWVDSPVLVESLRAMGIQDKGRNLSTNLKKRSEYFRLSGKAPHKKYKLTTVARTSALNLIRQLAKGEKNED